MTDHATNLYGEEPPKPVSTSTTSNNTPDDLATRMYGGEQEQTQTDAKPPAKNNDETPASRLYEAKEEARGNPYALERDTTDALYGGTNTVNLPDYLELDSFVASEEGGDADTLRTNLGYMAAEAGATQGDVTSLVTSASEFMRSGQKAQNEEQRGQILSEVMSQGRFSDDQLADARDLVASYPDLADWMARTGAGDDPKMVSQMLKLSQSPRAQRRLQQFRNRR